MTFSNFNQNRFQKPIPVKEGEEYDVTIENVGEKGDGIAKVKGYVIIVPQTKKGERVRIKVNAIRGKVSFGEVIERLEGETEEGEGEPEAETEEKNEESSEGSDDSDNIEDSGEDTEDSFDEDEEK